MTRTTTISHSFTLLLALWIASVTAFSGAGRFQTGLMDQTAIVRSIAPSLSSHIYVSKNANKIQWMLRMSEVNGNENNVDDIPKTPNSSKSSGLLTALVMGPPLIAKFLVVLTVKFMTDVIVYPLLWTYRLAKRMKNKLFRGRNSKSKLNEEEDMNATIKVIMGDKWGLRRDKFFQFFKNLFRK